MFLDVLLGEIGGVFRRPTGTFLLVPVRYRGCF